MSQPYIGEIRMFGGNFAPQGWAFCNGAIMAIDQNDALFNLIGTTYGGDGQTTFALPNLQSRIPMHVGPGFALAQTGGAESVTLTTQQIPTHNHVPTCQSTTASGQVTPANNVWAASPSENEYGLPVSAGMSASALGNTGGSQPHDNMVPFLVVNFILSLFGFFPSQ
jgi:microcystin-dependent protein